MSKKNVHEYARELIDKFPELKKYKDYSNVVISVLGAKKDESQEENQKKLITFYYKEDGEKKRKSFVIYSDTIVEELS